MISRVILLLLALSILPARAQAPAVRIVLFTPSDVAPPDSAPHRLTQIADSAENFFFKEMTRWGYPPAVRHLFRHEADGKVEVLKVRGEKTVSSGRYSKGDCADEIIAQAAREHHVTGRFAVWWIFVYLGDRPVRFAEWQGMGNPIEGGHAIVNYDTLPGEIRPDLGLAEGFNLEYFLKATMHELGHAFGLPHVAPDATLNLGNSLMGPVNSACVERKIPNCSQTYLTQSSAAMLWKHPLFTGSTVQPIVRLAEYKPVFNKDTDTITVSGKVVADRGVHSVMLIDSRGKPNDEYGHPSYAARIGPGGSFQVEIKNPAKADGSWRILFCFDNGMVSGDGFHYEFADRGAVMKSFRFSMGEFVFDE
jgi:hypothetical protein